SRQLKSGDNILCAYYVQTGKEEAEPDLRQYLAQGLPDYMIPSFFIKLEKIPLTTNGKINRKELSEYPISNSRLQTHESPRNDIEKKLVEIWGEVLEIPKEKISIDENFFHIGGHSLRAVAMIAKLHKAFNVKLPLAAIFKTPSIRALSDTIKGLTKNKYASIEPAGKKEYYILSSAQKRLYVLQQMELGGTAYNMPHIIPLTETLSLEKLEDNFRKLIKRHESLRTSFHMINPVTPEGVMPVTPGEEIPIQVIHENVAFKIERFKIGKFKNGINEESLSQWAQREFFRTFDLDTPPLLRIGIVETTDMDTDTGPTKPGHDDRERFMLIDMHHIITDGISRELLIKEFFQLNKGENLRHLDLQYKDYAEWQNSSIQKQLMKQQEETWLKTFPGELPVLDIPTDYPRPQMQSFEGNTITFELNEKETGSLKETAKQNQTTLYMTILSTFTILLSKLSGQEDIIVGTATAGRRHAGLEKIIGMFVNTLAIRNYPGEEKTVENYLSEVKKNTLQAFENQEYPFEDLVDRLSVRRDTGRNPIFDVMFNMINRGEYKKQNTTTLSTPSTTSTTSTPSTTSKFDLTLIATDTGDSLTFQFEYCTKLFKEETIKRYITYLKGILQAVCDAPNQKIAEIEIITKEEK
ncbi:MAG: non-ribosomal peptide synthetase, partial [bacterium]|nr:non-ribosomal peptide synthetase [bacterium]